MKLDSGNFCSPELAFGPDIINIILDNLAKSGPQASADTGLLAIKDRVIPDNMGADIFFGPANLKRGHDQYRENSEYETDGRMLRYRPGNQRADAFEGDIAGKQEKTWRRQYRGRDARHTLDLWQSHGGRGFKQSPQQGCSGYYLD